MFSVLSSAQPVKVQNMFAANVYLTFPVTESG